MKLAQAGQTAAPCKEMHTWKNRTASSLHSCVMKLMGDRLYPICVHLTAHAGFLGEASQRRLLMMTVARTNSRDVPMSEHHITSSHRNNSKSPETPSTLSPSNPGYLLVVIIVLTCATYACVGDPCDQECSNRPNCKAIPGFVLSKSDGCYIDSFVCDKPIRPPVKAHMFMRDPEGLCWIFKSRIPSSFKIDSSCSSLDPVLEPLCPTNP